MAIRKIARLVRIANTDAELARRTAHSPEFREAVTKDRRTALSRFTTVQDALRDRERILAAKGGKRANDKTAKPANNKTAKPKGKPATPPRR